MPNNRETRNICHSASCVTDSVETKESEGWEVRRGLVWATEPTAPTNKCHFVFSWWWIRSVSICSYILPTLCKQSVIFPLHLTLQWYGSDTHSVKAKVWILHLYLSPAWHYLLQFLSSWSRLARASSYQPCCPERIHPSALGGWCLRNTGIP